MNIRCKTLYLAPILATRIPATLRAVILAMATACAPAAIAQTPSDIAHQIWPEGAPTDSSNAPPSTCIFAGARSARDIARYLISQGPALPASSSPMVNTAFATGGGPADLARLLDLGMPTSTVVAATARHLAATTYRPPG
jgi:hypothetical protein